jgi:hypothetical protein
MIDLYFSTHMVEPININERDLLIDNPYDVVLVAFGIIFLVRVILGLLTTIVFASFEYNYYP